MRAIRPRRGSKAAIVRAWVIKRLRIKGPAKFAVLIDEAERENPGVSLDTIRMAIYNLGKDLNRTKEGLYCLSQDDGALWPDVTHIT